MLPGNGAGAPGGGGFHAEDTFLPVAIERVRIYEDAERSELFTQATLIGSDPEKGSYRLNICLLDDSGAILVEIVELEMKRVARHDSAEALDSMYTIRWMLQSDPPQQHDAPDVSNESWVIFADDAELPIY